MIQLPSLYGSMKAGTSLATRTPRVTPQASSRKPKRMALTGLSTLPLTIALVSSVSSLAQTTRNRVVSRTWASAIDDLPSILGESAGGGSVLHQITAYGSNGSAPFKRAILQSPGFEPDAGATKQTMRYSKALDGRPTSVTRASRPSKTSNGSLSTWLRESTR
ncbi:hypothetical protein LZ30DRAFT_318696 [Colletotrichum cereale]|nr:hypothetical protein LZ30DRAFT_318696 [Colletotrichum cereale]